MFTQSRQIQPKVAKIMYSPPRLFSPPNLATLISTIAAFATGGSTGETSLTSV